MSEESDPGQYSSPRWSSSVSQKQYPPSPQQGSYSAPQPYSQQAFTPAQLGDMVTLPPPPSHLQQELYRPHNAPYDMYPGGPPQMPYPPQQNPHQPNTQAPMAFNQPAPRQRTAIACRYCRRRKIRCHGFDSSPDGRCTNCLRFHQECIFTPVSSQAHAFVPAHTAYPHLRNTGRVQQTPDGRPIYPQGQPIIYGAHGQPLGPVVQPGHDPNYPPPPQNYGASPYPGPPYDDRGPPQPHPQNQVSRKRRHSDEHSHPSQSPPKFFEGLSSHPYPLQQRLAASSGARRSSAGGYEYPDPTHMAPVSPASSATSYQTAPYGPQAQQQPYYPSQAPAQRSSPQSSYSYEARASGSPHGSSSSASGYSSYPGGLHPPQVLPATYDSGRTPPPAPPRETSSAANGSSRPGMSVRDMLGPSEGNQGGRSSADSDMLKALNRRGM